MSGGEKRLDPSRWRRALFAAVLAAGLYLALELAAWAGGRLLPAPAGFATFDTQPLDYGTSPLKIRGRGSDAPPAGFRIVCLGDSMTFGHGVGPEATYPTQLEAELRRRRPDLALELLNAGQRGFNAVAQANYLARRIEALAPDLVLWQLLRNDVEPNSHYFTLAMPRLLRDPPFPLSASPLFHLLHRRVLLPRWHGTAERELRSFYDPPSRAWGYFVESLAWGAEECARRNVPVVAFVCPLFEPLQRLFLEEERQIEAAARAAGLEVARVRPELPLEGADLAALWVSPADHHPNRAGHALLAAAVLRAAAVEERLPPPQRQAARE